MSTEVRRFAGVDDLSASVGTVLGPTDWLEISQDRVNLFAEATGDHQWIHVDADKAAAGPFGRTIAHGFLTLSLLPMFGPMLYAVDSVSMGINYGVDKVRFPAPLPVGSMIRATATIGEATPIKLGLRVAWDWEVEAEGVDKPVCVARTLAVVVP